MSDKFYNNQFGQKPPPPWKHTWPTVEEQQKYWRDRDQPDREPDDPRGQMHRCPQCGCLFSGGEA
jgi:hypothetical protein